MKIIQLTYILSVISLPIRLCGMEPNQLIHHCFARDTPALTKACKLISSTAIPIAKVTTQGGILVTKHTIVPIVTGIAGAFALPLSGYLFCKYKGYFFSPNDIKQLTNPLAQQASGALNLALLERKTIDSLFLATTRDQESTSSNLVTLSASLSATRLKIENLREDLKKDQDRKKISKNTKKIQRKFIILRSTGNKILSQTSSASNQASATKQSAKNLCKQIGLNENEIGIDLATLSDSCDQLASAQTEIQKIQEETEQLMSIGQKVIEDTAKSQDDFDNELTEFEQFLDNNGTGPSSPSPYKT